MNRSEDLVVIVGAGGIGAPAAVALAAAGVRALRVVDDDRVALSNLHRQILFTDADVGRPKLDAFAEALSRRSPGLAVELHRGRALPDTVAALVQGAAVVVDATVVTVLCDTGERYFSLDELFR